MRVDSPPSNLLADAVLAKARAIFPHTGRGMVYLNHASTAPMSTRVVDAILSHLTERSSGMVETFLATDVAKIAQCKSAVSKLINAESPDRIALMSNTSEGLNTIASGLTWRNGDRVLLQADEFPANVYPYLNLKRHGVEVDFIEGGCPLTAETIERSVSPKTRLLAVSAVQFLTGSRAELDTIGTLCRDKGILMIVDGTQAVGAIQLDVQAMNIDALAAGSQKWQMGPQGTGFLYLTEDLQSRIQQAHLGWLAVEEPWEFFNYDQELATSGRRYEGGTRNIPGIWGMEAAVSTLLEFGPEQIERHILSLTRILMNGLQSIPDLRIITPFRDERRAGIVTIELPDDIDEKATLKSLAGREIVIAIREKRLRFSPHFYNSPDEMAFATETTREVLNK